VTLGFFYSRLAWQSIRRNPGLAALMVLGLALGIATWVTARAAIQGALQNPLPEKPGLYHVSLVRPTIFEDVPPDTTVGDNRMESGPKLTLSETEARRILAARHGAGAITPTLSGRAAVRQQLIDLATEHGFDIQDLFGKGRKGKGSVAVKYRDSHNRENTWTGRGRMPRWMVAAMKGGKAKRDDFLIG